MAKGLGTETDLAELICPNCDYNQIKSRIKFAATPKEIAQFDARQRIIISSKRKPCKLSDLYLASKYFT